MKLLPQESRVWRDKREATSLDPYLNRMKKDRPPSEWYCTELPVTAYEEVWQLQTELVKARKERRIDKDIVLLLEHPSVFTLGRSGGKENLRVSESFLKKTGTQVVHVERGGSITYHGPGQLIGYPIIDLAAFKLRVVDYVGALEEVMIQTASQWDIDAKRDARNRGIWVGDNKLGSIGIAVRRGVSFHGFALNVCVSLEPFCWIHPCGLQGIGMTSLEKELSRSITVNAVKDTVKQSMEDVFNVNLVPIDLKQILEMVNEAQTILA